MRHLIRSAFFLSAILSAQLVIFGQSYPPSGGGTGAANLSVGWTTATTTAVLTLSPGIPTTGLPIVGHCESGSGYTGTPPNGYPTGSLIQLPIATTSFVPTFTGSTLTSVTWTFASIGNGICSLNTNGGQGATGAQGPAGANGTNGTNGTNGNTINNGAGAPSSGTGVNGDFYLNTTSSCLYGPKAAGAWPGSCVSLIGPTGAAGAAGAPSCATIGACTSVYATTQVAVTQAGAGIQSFTQGGAPSVLPANSVSLWAPSSVPNAFGCTFWGVPAAGLVHATNNTYCVLSVSAVVWADTDQTTIAEAGTDVSAVGVVQGLESTPFCTGYTPTNGKMILYTTGGSPNPCYTTVATTQIGSNSAVTLTDSKGNLTATVLAANMATPTAACGVGAGSGTGLSCGVPTGTANSGQWTLTTATGTIPTVGVIATFTFSANLSAAPNACQVQGTNGVTTALGVALIPHVGTINVASFVLTSGGTALASGATYAWSWICL